jgi:hypothetical protein
MMSAPMLGTDPTQSPAVRSRQVVQRAVGGGVAALACFVIVGALIPARWTAERERVIAAPPEAVSQTIEDVRGWPQWSPWGPKGDPSAKVVHSGPERGDGATLVFEGPSLGTGSVAIHRADPGHLTYTLTAGDLVVEGEVLWRPESTGTRVTWRAAGEVSDNPAMRWVGLLRSRNAARAMDEALTGLAAEVEEP